MIYKRVVFTTAIMILSICNVAMGADCLMGRYEPGQTGYTLEKLNLPLAVSWESVANKCENNGAAPVVADGKAYFASGDRIYGVDLETGTIKWRYPSDQGLGGAIKCTPAVSNGKVFFGAGSSLYCIGADIGNFLWAYQTRGALRCPPVIRDGVVYFGSDDNSVYAVSAETGDAVSGWSKSFVARDDISVGIAINAGMVVMSCMDGNMYGIMANSGKLRWQFRLPMAPTDTSPITTENMAIMAVGNIMYGLTAGSGQMRWMVNLPSEAAATPAASGFDIYVPCKDKKIYAYSTAGRKPVLKWAEPADLGTVPMSSPVIAGDAIWVTGSKGVVAAYSVTDGSLKWRYTIAPSVITTPGTAYCDAASSPVIAEGMLLVLTDDGVLHSFSSNAPDSAPAGIFSMSPSNGTIMSGVAPIKISAILYDIGSGVDFNTVSILVDNRPMDGLVTDLAKGSVTYITPIVGNGKQATTLANGNHTITVSAKDYKGNILTKDWYIIADNSLPPPKISTPTPTGKRTKAEENHQSQPIQASIPSTPPMPPGMESPPPPPPPPPMPGPGEQF